MFETSSSADRPKKSGVAWRACLVAGLAGVAVCALLPPDPAGILASLAFGTCAAAAILVGLRLNGPVFARPWRMILVGQVLSVVGDAARGGQEVLLGAGETFPSLADLSTVAGRIVLLAGIVLLLRRRGREMGALVDAAIVAVGVGVLTWLFLVAPHAPVDSPSVLERLVPPSYPLLSALYLAALARLLLGPGPRPLPLYLLGASLAISAVSDVLYAISGSSGAAGLGHPVGYAWLVAYALLGTAALHPSMEALAEPGGEAPSTRRGIVPVAATSLFAPAVLVVQYLRGESLHIPVVVGGSVALFLLSLVRLGGLVRAAAFAGKKLERAVGREEVIYGSAAALVAATDRQTVYDSALESARALTEFASEFGSVRIALGSPEEMMVVAAAGPEAKDAEGTRIFSRDLPITVRGALLQHRSTSVERAACPWLSGIPGAKAPSGEYFFVPLVASGGMRGVILVSAGSALEEGVRRGLESLGVQVAFALERTEITENLHQRRSEERFESLVQTASDAIVILEADGKVRYVSPSYEQVLGYKPEDATGRDAFELVHPDDAARVREFFERVIASPGVSPSMELQMRHANGTWRHAEVVANNLLDAPNVGGIVANLRDVTEREQSRKRLEYQAYHDELTDLPNRTLLMNRLRQTLVGRPSRREGSVATLFFDLDRFNILNDSLGHDAGDKLLVAVGKRVQACLRPEDTVARLGGDEFVVLLEDVEGVSQVIYVAERIAKLFEAPFMLEDREVRTSASIGIALGNTGRDEPADLLRNADIAMYRAKSRGVAETNYEVFDAEMGAYALRRLEKETDVRRAIEREEFVVYYQPKVDLASGGLHGFEALVRWQHPERGLVPPGEFIPLAEETGSIVSIGRYVLEEACRRAKVWRERYGPGAPAVGVNIAAAQFQRKNLPEVVGAVLEETGLHTDALLLEVTESAMMEDAESSGATLMQLKELGVRIAIDDFGTGYSSLSYLQRFPLDMLKIDRSFVVEMEKDPKGSAIIEAVCNLGQSLEMQVLAEGVETSEQLTRLRDLGCELGQGYFWSRPVPHEEAEEMISRSLHTATNS